MLRNPLIVFLTLGILSGLVFVPVGAIFFRAWSEGGEFQAHLFSPETWALAAFTLKQAALSLVLSCAIGVPLGAWFGRDWSERVRAGLLTAYAMPSLMTAMAVTLLFRGWEFRFSLFSVIFAHALLNAPWIAAAVAEGRHQFPARVREAARTLGATSARVFFEHEIPFVASRLAQACANVFALCVMSFALVLLLGGGPPVQTLETEIYASLRMGEPDFLRASAFAVVQLALALLPFGLLRTFRVGSAERGGAAVPVPPVSRSWAPVAVSRAFLIPYLWILVEGGAGAARDWGVVFGDSEVWHAAAVSLRLAFGVGAAVLVASACVVFTARNMPWIEGLALLPSGVSALVLGLGFWFAYGAWVDPFEGSLLAMVGIQAALLLPFGVRALVPLIRESDARALEAARTLGAGPLRAWWDVELPRFRGPALSVFGIAGACSLGEVAAVSLFASDRVTPLPLLLTRFMARYEFEKATLISLFLFLLSWLLVRFTLRAGKWA